jgi:hypothetical protein
MNRCTLLATVLGAGLAALLLGRAAEADDTPKPAEGTLVLIDGAGKEQKLKAWHFVAGIRHLSWLAPAAPPKEGPPEPKERGQPRRVETGPEALEFRAEDSTNYVDGVLTLIPLERLRAIDYDHDKDTVTVHVATGGEEETLTGSTKFRGINKLTLAAEVDKGDLGVAEVKYQGGVPKGINGIRFAEMKVAAPPAGGRSATVTVADKEKNVQKATDLQPLYHLADGSERLVPTLFFRKTLKIDVGKLRKLRAVESKEAPGSEWEVTLGDGNAETFTLLPKVPLDGKEATLEGLVGRVPAGYKLFPVHTLAEVEFGEP